MPVDICQWRAAIGLFRSSATINQNVCVQATFSAAYLIFKLYLFCYAFISISVPFLPLAMIVHAIFQHSIFPNSRFLHIFAKLYTLAKSIIYITFELTKRICLLVSYPARRKSLKRFLLGYVYFYAVCLISYTLQLQWTIYRHILLSPDIETNPGPDQGTFKFCSWNLNSLCAHEFIRVSLIEAYNSVYNYDLIGVVETHLDSTVDERKLALNGYSFMKNSHPQNVKRGGVGLYVKESFPAKNRSDLETLPECIVCEIQLNGKKYFFAVLYRSS